MNENCYLTEKDLKFIEALKEEHRINGDKSFFETLFAGLYWVNTSDFKDLLRTIITDRIEFINNIDWLFSFGGGWVVGKYKYHFIILDDGGNIFPYGFFYIML